ncbi:MAG: radical SAM protein [Bacteroidales bacterium]|nr:radical SAM protein [Bacteroidales bacterium]
MANVLLTQKCVRNCPYCFAKEHMEGKQFDDNLKWDDLIYIADFFAVSKSDSIHLLGGEPTLHPDFCNICLYLLDRGFRITVFTSGIMSPNKLKELESKLLGFAHEKLSFVCNVNDPLESPESEIIRQKDFFSIFAKNINPGFNIYKPNFSLNFIFEYFKQFPLLHKHIRIGLTHPIVGEKNVALSKADMPNMAKQFMSFVPYMLDNSITAGFDCGMPMCLFDDAELGKLYKMNKGRIKFSCGSAIDIGPDLSVWSCFPLANHEKKSLYDFNSLHDITQYFSSKHNPIRNQKYGIFQECASCNYRNKELCAGGCLAHLL